jgi:hypothetical protein
VDGGTVVQSVGEALPAVALHLTVLADILARLALVTRPEAVNDPVTVSPEIDGDVERTTFPADPVTGYSPAVPALS